MDKLKINCFVDVSHVCKELFTAGTLDLFLLKGGEPKLIRSRDQLNSAIENGDKIGIMAQEIYSPNISLKTLKNSVEILGFEEQRMSRSGQVIYNEILKITNKL